MARQGGEGLIFHCFCIIRSDWWVKSRHPPSSWITFCFWATLHPLFPCYDANMRNAQTYRWSRPVLRSNTAEGGGNVDRAGVPPKISLPLFPSVMISAYSSGLAVKPAIRHTLFSILALHGVRTFASFCVVFLHINPKFSTASFQSITQYCANLRLSKRNLSRDATRIEAI